MKDVLLLVASLLIAWALMQVEPFESMHDTSGSPDMWPPPRFEKIENERVEVCPYCGQEIK